MATPAPALVRVCTLTDLQNEAMKVVSVENRTILVLLHDGAVHAIDNRCPHMGFPLSRGTVDDGILTLAADLAHTPGAFSVAGCLGIGESTASRRNRWRVPPGAGQGRVGDVDARESNRGHKRDGDRDGPYRPRGDCQAVTGVTPENRSGGRQDERQDVSGNG